MKYIITESQLKKIIDSEIDERSRTLANTRKKRIFPKSALMSNPDRFKEYDKEVKNIKDIKEEDVSPQEQEFDSLLMSAGVILTPEEKSEIQPNCEEYETPSQYSKIVDKMDKNGLVNTLKQVLSIQKKSKSPQPTQEQLAPVIIAGVSVPGVAVVIVAGVIALIIVVKLGKLIFGGRSRSGVNPGCKRRRKLVRKFGFDGNFM
jgi:hypothetical protein